MYLSRAGHWQCIALAYWYPVGSAACLLLVLSVTDMTALIEASANSHLA